MEETNAIEKKDTYKEHFAILIGEPVDSPFVKQFMKARHALLKDEKLSGAKNIQEVLEAIALSGILPIPPHSYIYINHKNGLVWVPSAKGMIYRACKDGIVESLDCWAIYQPDTVEPFDIEKMTDAQLQAWQKMDCPPIKWIQNPGPRKDLIASMVKMVCNGRVTFDILWADQAFAVRDNYAQKNNEGKFSPAWIKSESEMIRKIHVKRVLKYKIEQAPGTHERMERIIDQDNIVDYDLSPKVITADAKEVKTAVLKGAERFLNENV